MTMKSLKVGEIVGNIPLNVEVGGVEGEDQDHLCFDLEDRVVRTETQEMDKMCSRALLIIEEGMSQFKKMENISEATVLNVLSSEYNEVRGTRGI